ncbi:MAG: ATP-dependent helicase [Chitinophagales bacterium]|nr:ATP-dependent helicase [Chitinophagales bacterium]
MPPNQFPDEFEQELHNFLKTFGNFESDITESTTKRQLNFSGWGGNEQGGNNSSFYRKAPNTPVPDTVQARIEKLKAIIQAIEKKSEQTPPAEIPPGKTFKLNYTGHLNPSQLAAVTNIKGPMLVIAGAGSGKTHTVTYRVAYMLENDISAENMLLLTFTRRAAQQIIHRTNRLLQNTQAEQIMRGTYHAFANYSLRRYANLINLPSNFTIVDVQDSEDIIDLIRNEFKFDATTKKAFPKKGRLQEIISKARNCDIPIAQVIDREYTGLYEYIEPIDKISKIYAQYKKANRIFDYDDLMDELRNALRDHKTFRRKMGQQYQYIMVDEFQDTNTVQKDIIDLIAADHQNVMIVGDDAQSIYGFRGANFENILLFPETYPNCRIVKLEQNYRSTQPILDFSNIIANNARMGYQKHLFSVHKSPNKPTITRLADQEDEATYIVDKIMALHQQNIPFSQMAVLYRSSYHGNYIQAELLRRNIPYIVVGGVKFIERRHVKDIMSLLRLVLNPYDPVAWNRSLNLLPGVGKVTASKILANIRSNQGQLNPHDFEKTRYASYLEDLKQALSAAANPRSSVSSKIARLRQYYQPLLLQLEDDAETRIADLDVLEQMALKYESLEKFLSEFALDPPSTQFQNQARPLIDESEEPPLTLSTIHSAKGLEWYAVFIPHLLDGLFPNARSMRSFEAIEEERRLFYVACTRAKEQLCLTMPAWVSSFDEYFSMPSRFVSEIPDNLYEH